MTTDQLTAAAHEIIIAISTAAAAFSAYAAWKANKIQQEAQATRKLLNGHLEKHRKEDNESN